MKTIREIANELGVSKQRVYRFVKSNHISEAHHDVHQTTSTKYYDDVAIDLIKRGFSKETVSDELHHEAHHDVHQTTSSDTVSDTVVEALLKQLEKQSEQIDSLHKLLDQQQQLQLHTQRQLDQLQLEFKGAAGDEVKEETKETVQTEQPKKKSKWKFWNRGKYE